LNVGTKVLLAKGLNFEACYQLKVPNNESKMTLTQEQQKQVKQDWKALEGRNAEAKRIGFTYETEQVRGPVPDQTMQKTAVAAIISALKERRSMTKHEMEAIALNELQVTKLPDDFVKVLNKVINKFTITAGDLY